MRWNAAYAELAALCILIKERVLTGLVARLPRQRMRMSCGSDLVISPADNSWENKRR